MSGAEDYELAINKELPRVEPHAKGAALGAPAFEAGAFGCRNTRRGRINGRGNDSQRVNSFRGCCPRRTNLRGGCNPNRRGPNGHSEDSP